MKHCTVCHIKVGSNNMSLLCKACRVRQWHESHKERVDQIKRTYLERHPDRKYETIRAYKERNRERVNAWALLQYNVDKGTIAKPDHCENCGEAKRLHGHHPDIQKPLEVKWVCAKCHKAEHGYGKGVYA